MAAACFKHVDPVALTHERDIAETSLAQRAARLAAADLLALWLRVLGAHTVLLEVAVGPDAECALGR